MVRWGGGAVGVEWVVVVVVGAERLCFGGARRGGELVRYGGGDNCLGWGETQGGGWWWCGWEAVGMGGWRGGSGANVRVGGGFVWWWSWLSSMSVEVVALVLVVVGVSGW